MAGLDDGIRSPDEVLRRGAEALDLAQSSGGNLVVRHGEFDQDEAWSALAAPGKIFEGAVARDVMTPFPDTLRPEELASEAEMLLRRARLAAMPAVDDKGKLLGIVSADLDAEDSSARATMNETVAQVMHREVRCLDESAGFAELIEGFRADAASPIVITHNGRPTGLIMPESLGLLGQKLDKERLCRDGFLFAAERVPGSSRSRTGVREGDGGTRPVLPISASPAPPSLPSSPTSRPR